MGDFKSKLPDLDELTSMTSKLFKGISSSVKDIIHDYKEKRAKEDQAIEKADKKAAKEEQETKKGHAAAPKGEEKK